jgi:ribonuclease BN (tRNA processing enzyme)
VHNGKNIVIDMGCGSLTKLLGLIRPADLDALVLSHLHADHMGDVLTLRYALDASKKMGQRMAPLPVYLPAEPETESGLISRHGMMDAHLIEDGMNANICGIDVRFSLMPHPVPSYAMRFEAEGKAFVYSGDTRENDKLAPFASGADLLVMEAAFLSRDKVPGAPHVNAVEAGTIALDAQVKRMLVTHIFPEYNENDILNEVRESFPSAELIEEMQSYEV